MAEKLLSKRALVVEDNEFMLKKLADMLQKQGYEVTTASTFLSALSKVREGFDFVISDLQLSDTKDTKGANKNEGITVAMAARSVRKDTPILIVSAETLASKVALVERDLKDVGGNTKFLSKMDSKFLSKVISFACQDPDLPAF